ncbi:uncharacterized protein CDAR_534171 [Caerostris darwini]|uniref:Gustatory receptor n=1 Tax=Caerostris darwini TaxID=1538125 RepID=A0AAV4SA20_9ARAC|nr:uncharacterized protein CDAR_534171 [Caerostris darwini]
MSKHTLVRPDQLICLPTLESYARSQDKLILPSRDKFFFKMSNLRSETQVVPSFLWKFILMFGLVAESDKHAFYKITIFTFHLIAVFSITSGWISALIQFDIHRFKLKFANLMSFVLALGISYTMRRKRKSLSITIRKLSKISVCPQEKKINYLVLFLSILPIIYAVYSSLAANLSWLAKYHAFGNNIESKMAQILIIVTQCFLSAVVHPTFTNLVALLYCILCQCCTSALTTLTQEILQMSPKQFGPYKQLDILRRKAKIDDILEKIQAIFSLPAFFLIAGNFLSCGSVIGKHLYFGKEMYRSYHMKESVFYGISSFFCLTIILWVAGGVPIQVQKLKEAFYKKEHLRLLTITDFDEPTLKKGLFEDTDFVFTGCDIISFKRSTILALFGALLTYTVLAVSTTHHTD